MDVRVAPKTRLSTEELMLSNCDAGETLESALDCKVINQSILKEINPEYSFEGEMLKLKVQSFGYLM